MGYLRSIDYATDSPISVVNSFQLSLDSGADITWAVSCHGYNLSAGLYQPLIDSNKIKFITIELDNADKNFIAWEFIVKTYLSKRRGMDWAQRNKHWIIDDQINLEYITDQDRISKMKELLKKPLKVQDRSLPSSIPATVLEYTKLFQPGGSRYLCEQLNIEAPDSYHNFWNTLLPFANSPTSIQAWGVNWQRDDCFTD
jgi:hypothetical protein